jgi:hypothetical protein
MGTDTVLRWLHTNRSLALLDPNSEANLPPGPSPPLTFKVLARLAHVGYTCLTKRPSKP